MMHRGLRDELWHKTLIVSELLTHPVLQPVEKAGAVDQALKGDLENEWSRVRGVKRGAVACQGYAECHIASDPGCVLFY